ncbi:serine/threonine protein kinase [Capronia epimyces CBS 606.96]|uniref:Serine/threonine protein kinase n=1 Tax=Capronia epimyces CBS 606.96 TaxID=1182542 RepID=W9YBK1_9EURO|nr:serine/threonine protein kinase [Capronia epimyces CBS 606.96]EXJ79744.1 serine/threonine protein kinase [Capronia epimyces CBS 606.96]
MLLNEWYHDAACGRQFVNYFKLLDWMTKTDTNEKGKNVARLLRELHQLKAQKPLFFDSSVKIATEEDFALRVFGILLELDRGDFIHAFSRANIVDKHLAVAPQCYVHLAQELNNEGLSALEAKDLIEDFDHKRWSFIPVTISYNMSRSLHDGQWVLPFLKKERINGKGGTADVYQVLVQEYFIDPVLRDAIKKSRFHDKDYGWCYQLALKTYSPRNKDFFEWEKVAFKGLRGQPGMVQYLGDYVFEEIPNEPESWTYNILLELGELDLDEFFADQHSYPPVRTPEIIAFWSALFKVAEAIKRLHNLERRDEDGVTEKYHGWHADIKLDNILRVHGEYKLADFGFAKFKRIKEEPPTEYIEGGTQTYGPPETDPKRVRGTSTAVTQTIDTWSFGCVLSIAVTWVILGYQGILQYETLRKQAIANLKRRQEQETGLTTPTAHDAFHNGYNVLPEVLQWHNYLHTISRRSDSLSMRVLGLVEQEMLLGSPQQRISSTALCERLKFMLKAADMDYANSRRDASIHESVLKALLEYDQQAPANSTQAARAKSAGLERLAPPSASSRGSAAAQDAAPRKSRRIGKSERLDNIPRGKTAHRAEDLERELQAQADVHEPEPSAMSDLYDSPVEEADGAMIPSFQRPVTPTPRFRPRPQQINVTQLGDPTRKVKPPNGPDPATNPQLPRQPYQPPNGDQGRPQVSPSSMWPRPRQPFTRPPPVREPESSPEPKRSTPPRMPPGPVLVPTLEPSLDICRVREELERNRPNRIASFVGIPKKDLYLKKFIKNRDIKFIVDNGTTMLPFWGVATYVLETLTLKLAGLDEDGLDLVFTIGEEFNINNARRANSAARFQKAMQEMTPKDPGDADEEFLRTDMTAVLGRVFDEYLKTDRHKAMTLLILTDGLWLGSVKEDVVEKKIADFVKELNSMEPRRFSIEFIRFGDDRTAIKRLEALDNAMEDRYGIEDIIDTEPWTGRVRKMIVGSILEGEDLDENEREGPTPAASVPSSPGSGARPNGVRNSVSQIYGRSPSQKKPNPFSRLMG